MLLLRRHIVTQLGKIHIIFFPGFLNYSFLYKAEHLADLVSEFYSEYLLLRHPSIRIEQIDTLSFKQHNVKWLQRLPSLIPTMYLCLLYLTALFQGTTYQAWTIDAWVEVSTSLAEVLLLGQDVWTNQLSKI